MMEFVNGKDYSVIIKDNEKCSKPPTSIYAFPFGIVGIW
jgi:hypothetical protein